MTLINDNSSASAGKYRRLLRLSDDQHRFAMLAIDQRGSLRKMVSAHTGVPVDSVPDEALETIKSVVTTAVAPLSTAVLTDPLHGYPASPDSIPANVGLLLALEVTGYEAAGEAERLSTLIEGWSARRIGQVGADAVKLLLWHRHDASDATQKHQDDLVEQVGRACEEEGLPYVLEIVTYPLGDMSSSSAEYAREKPEIVIDAVRRFSEDRFRVDVLKMEFPGNLKYVDAYSDRAFAKGEVVHTIDEIKAFCQRLDETSRVPWVILSAGVDPEEFIENVRLANEAGASGFLCGRAVWKRVIDHYPDVDAMRAFSESTARDYFSRIREANDGARPWTSHPRFQQMS